MNFKEKLLAASRANKSWLCVGLDPDIQKIPKHLGSHPEAILEFNISVINATSDLVCAFKPNSAFYEYLGADGWKILSETIKSIPGHIPVILDFKRGDIGNTAAMYAGSAFDRLGVDAVTVTPYLGRDSIEPFARYSDKGVFILCLTSNPSSSEIQKQMVLLDNPPSVEDMALRAKAKRHAEFSDVSTLRVYHHIARLASEWNIRGNIGLVVGATSPGELALIRGEIGNDIPILIPGVGAQGGDLERSVESGSNSSGEMAIINVSRGVIYAGTGENFRDDVRDAAESFRSRISESINRKKKT